MTRKVRRHLVRWALREWGYEDIEFTKTSVSARWPHPSTPLSMDWCQEALARHVIGDRNGASGCLCGKCP